VEMAILAGNGCRLGMLLASKQASLYEGPNPQGQKGEEAVSRGGGMKLFYVVMFSKEQ